jgi:hypothetical protein
VDHRPSSPLLPVADIVAPPRSHGVSGNPFVLAPYQRRIPRGLDAVQPNQGLRRIPAARVLVRSVPSAAALPTPGVTSLPGTPICSCAWWDCGSATEAQRAQRNERTGLCLLSFASVPLRVQTFGFRKDPVRRGKRGQEPFPACSPRRVAGKARAVCSVPLWPYLPVCHKVWSHPRTPDRALPLRCACLQYGGWVLPAGPALLPATPPDRRASPGNPIRAARHR